VLPVGAHDDVEVVAAGADDPGVALAVLGAVVGAAVDAVVVERGLRAVVSLFPPHPATSSAPRATTRNAFTR
jgi:hypothetical protein